MTPLLLALALPATAWAGALALGLALVRRWTAGAGVRTAPARPAAEYRVEWRASAQDEWSGMEGPAEPLAGARARRERYRAYFAGLGREYRLVQVVEVEG